MNRRSFVKALGKGVAVIGATVAVSKVVEPPKPAIPLTPEEWLGNGEYEPKIYYAEDMMKPLVRKKYKPKTPSKDGSWL